MGQPKPFVTLGGRLLLSRVLDTLRPLCGEVFIVADKIEPYEIFGSRVVPDLIPDRGPMGGVYTALSSAHEREVFVTGCDTPFLDPALVRHLASLAKGYEAVVPFLSDGLHPLLAIYTRDCLSELYERLIAGHLSLMDYLKAASSKAAKVRIVTGSEIDKLDPERASFFNINTPEDLAVAEELLRWRETHPGQGEPS